MGTVLEQEMFHKITAKVTASVRVVINRVC